VMAPVGQYSMHWLHVSHTLDWPSKAIATWRLDCARPSQDMLIAISSHACTQRTQDAVL
jgi:hypothetical protein